MTVATEPDSAPKAEDTKKTPPPGPVNLLGIRLGYALGAAGWLACFFAASQIGRVDGTDAVNTMWLNVLVCLVGSIIGWWLGILLSPDPTEKGNFIDFRKALSAFLSGFVLAKVDILFQGAVSQDLTNSPLFLGRIALFVTTTLICAQFTYVARHDLGMYGVRHAARQTDTKPQGTGEPTASDKAGN